MILQEILAADQIGFPVLSTLILLPLLAAAALIFVKDERFVHGVVLVAVLVELLLSVLVVALFVPGIPHAQFAERIEWIETLGAGYHLGVDGISVLFLPLTAFASLAAVLISLKSVRFMYKSYFAMLLLLESVTIGVFAALDLILFFAFWELMLVPAYFLIRAWGSGPRRQHAALKYVMYMLLGSVPLVVGIILLGLNYRAVTGAPTYSFDLVSLLAVPVRPEVQTLIFFLAVFAFAVKAPLVPFHTWMPTVLTEGPIGLGLFLGGIKMGIYGFLRIAVPLVPGAAVEWSWLMTALGAIAVVYAGLIALAQANLRRLLAFASIGHVGLAVLGVFALNTQGIQGALMLTFHLGIVATVLLFLAGVLRARTGSSDLSAFGGRASRAPVLAAFFFLVGLAAIGVPGTSGFVGEFLVLMGAFRVHWSLATAGVLGVILSAAFFFLYYEKAFLGPVRGGGAKLHDLLPRETVIVVIAAVMIFWIGLLPGRFLHITSGSVDALVARVTQAAAADLAATK
ncbi:MAG: NuoM family protein [Vicinamibacterales bacterium]